MKMLFSGLFNRKKRQSQADIPAALMDPLHQSLRNIYEFAWTEMLAQKMTPGDFTERVIQEIELVSEEFAIQKMAEGEARIRQIKRMERMHNGR